MQDVSERGDIEVASEGERIQIAGDEIKARCQAEALHHTLCGGKHTIPVEGCHLYIRRALRQSDAPHARACRKIEHSHRALLRPQRKVPSQNLRSGIAQRKDVLHKALEERSAIVLCVDRAYWFARSHNVVQPKPLRQKLLACVLEDSALKAWLRAHEKRLALRRQRVLLAAARQKAKAGEDIHDAAQTTLGSAGRSNRFSKCLGRVIEYIKDSMTNGGFDSKRGSVSPRKLHQAFRGHRCGSAHLQ